MKQILTKDGSTTFYSEEAKDNYHTLAGGMEEAFEKHARALNIKEKENPVIFDICFGLGYSAAAAIEEIKIDSENKKNNKKITIYCFENDKKIIREILNINSPAACKESFEIIKSFAKKFLEQKKDKFKYEETKIIDERTIKIKLTIKLIMIFGDARKTIKKIKENADFVFFAPFSPAKVPELWTKEFFKDINSKMNSEGKLSTYSYAKFVRENLKNAGFILHDGPILGRRSPSTIAIKK